VRRDAWLRAAIALVLVAVSSAAGHGQAVPQEPAVSAPEAVLVQARLAFDAGSHETARELLDALIAGIGADVSAPAQRRLLASSYELRALTRLNLRDVDGARSDLRAMLLVSPSSLLPPEALARAGTLFDEVRAATVGDVTLTVTPLDASITLDGVPMAEVPPVLVMVGGTHTVSATRKGYRGATQTFTVVPGTPVQPIALVLDREFSTLTFSTAPAGIEVIVDGVSRGRTVGGARGTNGDEVSMPFTLDELLPGRHRLELRRDCFVGIGRDVDVKRPDDLALDVIRLTPAVGTVSVTSDTPGATIYLDGAPRGTAPGVVAGICEGPHLLEVKTQGGRDMSRLDVKTGQKVAFAARIRPSFAIVSAPAGGGDVGLATEAAFEGARSVMLFAPPAERISELSSAHDVPGDWLAFDQLRRPLGGAAAIETAIRQRASAGMAEALGAQGLAAVLRDPASESGDLLLTLLAPGSARPDVMPWRIDSPVSVRQVVERVDAMPAVMRTALGLTTIDVLDVTGAVVTAVEPGLPAAAAGVQAGEVVTSAGGTPVTSAAQLASIIDKLPSGQPAVIGVTDRAGQGRRVDVVPLRLPRVVLLDRTLPTNVLAVQLASQVASAGAPLEEVALRLNLAAAFMRLEHWPGARSELDRVVAMAGRGALASVVVDAVTGTAEYLRALCAEAAGDIAAAERAWAAVAASRGVLLAEGGPPISALAARQGQKPAVTGSGSAPAIPR
jgi:hypothetical protein